MLINTTDKFYLVSIDQKNDTCFVSPFDVTSIQTRLPDVYSYGLVTQPRISVEGDLHGSARILVAKDFDNITYEEIMDIVKEKKYE